MKTVIAFLSRNSPIKRPSICQGAGLGPSVEETRCTSPLQMIMVESQSRAAKAAVVVGTESMIGSG